MSIQERIGDVLRDLQGTAPAPGPLGELGLIVEDLAVTPAGKRRLVRIWLDRDLADLEPGDQSSRIEPLSLDEVADATKVISQGLDAADALGEAPYVLEVGSAGVDRPLTAPRHFRRNVTRLVQIQLIADSVGGDGGDGGGGGGGLTGRLVAAGPAEAVVIVSATQSAPEARFSIAYADVARAQVQVEFSHVPTDSHVPIEEES